MEIIGKWKLTDEVSVQGSDDSLFQSELAIHSIFKPAFGSNAEVEIILSCEINEESEALSVQVLVSHSLVATEAYNLGCFNHQVEDNKVTVTTLQNVKEPFRRFSLLRLGPDPQESCCEYFILEKQDFLRIAVAAATVDGIVHTISRVFKRVVGYPVANHKLEQVNKTYGWDVLKYWPVNAIELCELKVTRVLGVQTVPEPQQTTLWSLDQSIDEIKKNTYSSEPYADPANQLYFSIQITSGKSVWKVRRTHAELFALVNFIRTQDVTPDGAFQKPPPKFAWKSYVEFHRLVLALENILRSYFQNASHLIQNHVDGICAFFEIPEHLDINQVRLVETMIEEDSPEVTEGVRKFVSYRLDYIRLGKLQFSGETSPSAAPIPLSSLSSSSSDGTLKRGSSIYQNNQFGPKANILGTRRRSVRSDSNADSTTGSDAPDVRTDGIAALADRALSVDSSVDLPLDHSVEEKADDPTMASPITPQNATVATPHHPGLPPRPVPAAATVAAATATATARPTNVPNPNTFTKSYSSSLDELNELYEPKQEVSSSSTLKVLSVDAVSTPHVKSTIAKGLLYGALGAGIVVIKHGRQGQPKRKILKCDPDVTRLYWVSEKDGDGPLEESKYIDLQQVQYIRSGTDIDPLTSDDVLQQAAADGSLSTHKLMKIAELKEKLGMTKQQQAKSKSSLFGFLKPKEEGILYGTEVLRRTCKPEHMPLCLSLVTPDRSLDIQCLNQKDFNLLLINLREITRPPSAPGSPSSPDTLRKRQSFIKQNSMDGRDNPLKSSLKTRTVSRKSVRFSASDNELSEEQPATLPPAIEISQTPSLEIHSDSDDVRFSPATKALLQSSSVDSTPHKIIFHMRSDGDLNHLLDRSVDVRDNHRRQLLEDDEEDTGCAVTIRPSISDVSSLELGDSRDDDDYDSKPPRDGSRSPIRMSSAEAIHIGMILHGQEKKHNTNMYESLRPEDQPTVQGYVNKGFTTEEAILRVFEKKFGGVGVLSSDEEDNAEAAVSSSAESGRKSSFFPDLLASSSDQASGESKLELKLKANEALQIGLLLSQQEEEFGTNMYDSLRPEDESKVRKLCEEQGMTTYEAILSIFEKRYVHRSEVVDRGSDSQVQPQPEEVEVPEEAASPRSMQRARSSFFPNTETVLPAELRTLSEDNRGGPRRLNSMEAMELAMLLSDQEARFGTNMYDSLKAEDEPELQSLLQQGYGMEKAVEIIFDRKFNNTPQAAYAQAYAQPVAYPAYGAAPYGYPPMPGYYDPQYPPYPPQGYPQGYGYGAPQGYPAAYGYPPYGAPQGPGGYPYGAQQQAYPTPPYGYSPSAAGPQYSPHGLPGGYGPPQGQYGPPMSQQSPQGPPPQGPRGPQGYAQPPTRQPTPPMANVAVASHPPVAQAQPQSQAQAAPSHQAPVSLNSASESFYGEIVPTELTALVHGPTPPRPEHLRRFNSNLGPAPAHPSGQAGSHTGHAGHSGPGRGIAHADSAPVAVAQAPSADSSAPKRSLTKKLSIFSRKTSTNDNAAAFGLTNKNLKYKEADVKSIMQMGFSRDQAVWALVQNDNNVVNAIMSLTR